MKPVLIFRHVEWEGAGYLDTFLNQHQIPTHEIRIDLGQTIPSDVSGYSGVVLMGGPMSVNDGLPWIGQELAFIEQALDADTPLIGHCLGGQLISKALGVEITQNTIKEIGWLKVDVLENTEAKKWFGDAKSFLSFHWHVETFAIPRDATRILSSAYCDNQAYVLGKHLAMQCHIEITPAMARQWYEIGQAEVQAAIESPGVQSAEEMLEEIEGRIKALHQQAHIVYSHWIEGLQQ